MENITFNNTNITLNKTLVSANETLRDESILIFAIIGVSIFCVYCMCSESEHKQRLDIENKAIRSQNRITIKTLT